MKQLLLLTLFLAGCATNLPQQNKELKEKEFFKIEKSSKNYPVIIKHKKSSTSLNHSKINKKRVVEKKVTISQSKPLEVARVCVDKEGKMHNCTYKIPKPYKDSFERYNSIQ